MKKILFADRCFNHRKRILEISQKVKAIHVGGSFSSVEIIDALYFSLMKSKDHFILSKGHCCILLYTILEAANILKKDEVDNYCKFNSKLGVHPELTTKGIETSTGSLGHGLAIASGMALSNKLNKSKGSIYVLMSDGEMMEGSVWEAALFIGSKKINNLIAIVDNNDLQSATSNKDTHPNLLPIHKKFKNFGWESETCNGHNVIEIINKISKRSKKKPFLLVAKTKKGFPVSYMKNKPIWHYRSPNKEELLIALSDLEELKRD